mgnify:CR=1 FL=1
MLPTAQAAQQLDPTYNQAQAAVGAQVPAIQSLYSSLNQGLQQQGANQLSNVLQSAVLRGVSTPELAGNTQAALAQSLAQSQAQLGVQQGQNIAGANQQVGQLGVQRVNDITSLAQSLLSGNQQEQKAQMTNQADTRQQNLSLLKNQQNFNVNQQQYNTAQAKAAARAAASAAQFDITGVSQSQLTRQLRLQLGAAQGPNGKVGPKHLAIAYNTWLSAGLTPDSFWKAFQGKWDNKQADYNAQFHTFVNKGI